MGAHGAYQFARMEDFDIFIYTYKNINGKQHKE
jgi:hypothetical protein